MAVAGGYINLGSIYSGLDEHEKALTYYFKAMKILKSTDLNAQKNHLGILYNNIGTSYQKQKQVGNSNYYLREALKFAISKGDSMVAAMATHNLGINFGEIKQYDSAIVYYNSSLKYVSAFEQGLGHVFNYKQLGEAYSIRPRRAPPLSDKRVFSKTNPEYSFNPSVFSYFIFSILPLYSSIFESSIMFPLVSEFSPFLLRTTKNACFSSV